MVQTWFMLPTWFYEMNQHLLNTCCYILLVITYESLLFCAKYCQHAMYAMAVFFYHAMAVIFYHYVPKNAPDRSADEHVDRDEPPVKEVVNGDRLAEVDEDHAEVDEDQEGE